MRLSGTTIKGLCRRRGTTLNSLLKEANVSRTAYYSLARKESVLPKSILAIAQRLDVKPSAFLDEDNPAARRMQTVLNDVSAVLQRNPEANPDNVRHTLLLLYEKPVDRLRRALLRAQAVHLH